MIDIGSKRECFFDDYLIDNDKTTAEFMVHQPVRKNTVMVADMPWEGNGSTSNNIVFDGEKYIMHYIGRDMAGATSNDAELLFVNCIAYSKDGLSWERPVLNKVEINGNTENNIIGQRAKSKQSVLNSVISAFYDENPDCPEDERYKVFTVMYPKDKPAEFWLTCAKDEKSLDDGKRIPVEKGEYYDSIVCCFWDKLCKKYRLYVREYYIPEKYKGRFKDAHDRASYTYYRKRGIRYLESKDAKIWSESKSIAYTNEVHDYEIYENKIMPYYRAPHMYIGFPTRYNGRCYDERRGMPENFKEVMGYELRKQRFWKEDRFGVAVTDCAFMCSRDGENFYRHEEAFIRPGPENGFNWLYGDCYPAYGIIETPSDVKGAENEISIFVPEGQWIKNIELVRYTIRLDGFVSMHANGKKEQTVVTKPFVFNGKNLYANLSASAYGYMYFELLAEDGTKAESYEIFGDSTDKRITFTDENAISRLSGKTVVMTVKMLDADLYAIRFGE